MTASPDGAGVTTLGELALTIRSATRLDDVVAAVTDASIAMLGADAVRVPATPVSAHDSSLAEVLDWPHFNGSQLGRRDP